MNQLFKLLFIFTLLLSSSNLYATTSYVTSIQPPIDSTSKIIHKSIDFIYDIPDLKTLEEHSDLIIQAEVLPEKTEIIFSDSDYGFTKTSLKVNRVYKGNVKIDDIVPIAEEYFTHTSPITGKAYLEAYSFYTPTIIGQEYLFFLIDYHQIDPTKRNLYEIANISMGVYPIQQDNLPAKKLNTTPLKNDFSSVKDKRIYEYLSRNDALVQEEKKTYENLSIQVKQKYKDIYMENNQ